jgi:hypothetical protein
MQSSEQAHGRWEVLKACCLIALVPSTTVALFSAFNSERWISVPSRLVGALFLVALWTLACCLYMLPSVIAGYRGHHNRAAIIALNFLAGWTVLGWLIAFVWAFTSEPAESPR